MKTKIVVDHYCDQAYVRHANLRPIYREKKEKRTEIKIAPDQ